MSTPCTVLSILQSTSNSPSNSSSSISGELSPLSVTNNNSEACSIESSKKNYDGML